MISLGRPDVITHACPAAPPEGLTKATGGRRGGRGVREGAAWEGGASKGPPPHGLRCGAQFKPGLEVVEGGGVGTRRGGGGSSPVCDEARPAGDGRSRHANSAGHRLVPRRGCRGGVGIGGRGLVQQPGAQVTAPH